jgi:chromosome segregation ATPase
METLMIKPALRGTDRLTQTVATLARLLDQTMNDIQALDSEFQEQMEAVQEAQASIEQQNTERLRIAIDEAERSAGEVARLREAAAGWDAERAALLAECERARQLVDQTKREHDLALAETDEAAAIALERQVATAVERMRSDLTARFEADRAALIAERNRAQQRLADIASEYERQLAELAAVSAAPPQQSVPGLEAVQAEIDRVEVMIQGISRVVENPETELSVVIRKNVERAELESYLRGLRFRTATL